MISRQAKAFFYAANAPFMRLSAWIYKTFRAPRSGNTQSVKVQLGPGQKNYLEGWINVDANFLTAKIDVWADISNPLPFKNGSVDVFYSHHMIEHLPDLFFHFREMYRCLKPGGIIRVGGPNGDSAVKKFSDNELSWFGDFPDKRTSIGGRFENFIFCRREHLTILTFSFLEEIATEAGFKNIVKCLPTQETKHPEYITEAIFSKEWENDFEYPHTLLIEAEK